MEYYNEKVLNNWLKTAKEDIFLVNNFIFAFLFFVLHKELTKLSYSDCLHVKKLLWTLKGIIKLIVA